MSRGRKTSVTITLTPDERTALKKVLNSHTVPVGTWKRARIVWLRAQGLSIVRISAMVVISRLKVYRYLYRWQEQGMLALERKVGSGAARGRKAMQQEKNDTGADDGP